MGFAPIKGNGWKKKTLEAWMGHYVTTSMFINSDHLWQLMVIHMQ